MLSSHTPGRVRSEAIEDQHEEVTRVTDTGKETRITTVTSSIAYYGLAVPFSKVALIPEPALGNVTLAEFISSRNRESDASPVG